MERLDEVANCVDGSVTFWGTKKVDEDSDNDNFTSINSEITQSPISRFSITHRTSDYEMEKLKIKARMKIAIVMRAKFAKKKEKDSIFEGTRRKKDMALLKDSTSMGYAIYLKPELKGGLNISNDQ